MIPKIEFRYSMVYDGIWKFKNKPYKFMLNYTKSIEKFWRKKEKKVLIEIQKITGLKWKEKVVRCYIITNGRCFSDPLTIIYFKDKSRFIDTLVHEMIHQIQIQGGKNFRKWLNYLYKRYPNEDRLTYAHIFLHAVHKKIYLKLFNKKRLDRDIKICNKYPGYKRAWEIVEKEGYENIIKEFRKRIKT